MNNKNTIIDNDINDIDQRMAKAIREERKQQREKYKSRKNRAVARRLMLVCVLILSAVCLIFGLSKALASDVYSDEEGFTQFADSTFENDSVCPESGKDNRVYNYSEDFSYAVRYGDWVNGDIKTFIDKRAEDIEESTAQSADSMALLIDAAAFETENGVISTCIHYSTYSPDGRHMKMTSSHVDTYLFSEETGRRLDTVQIMNVNYKTKAKDYAYEFFEKTYSSRTLSKDWERFVTSDDTNFNKYVITDKHIVFFFDDGTVLQEGEGTPAVSIPISIIGSTIRPDILDRYIDKDKPMVALTFDDGPYTVTEDRILDTLEQYGGVATFFYLGNRVEDDHESAIRAVRIGCEIGNHSWNHPVLSQLDNKQIASQISKTNAILYKYCGVEPVVARPPYGEFNDKVLKKTGMAQILWSLDTMDWKSRNAKAIFKSVKKPKSLDGKIILMHSIYEESADAVELIVPWLTENGYQLVTVSELIKYRTGNPPEAGKVYRKLK